jgi:hypothetical protein
VAMTEERIETDTASLADDENLPRLEGWLNAAEIAEILDVSRSTAARWTQEARFRSLHGVGARPMRVARVEEVELLKQVRFDGDLSWDEAFDRLRKVSRSKLGLGGRKRN